MVRVAMASMLVFGTVAWAIPSPQPLKLLPLGKQRLVDGHEGHGDQKVFHLHKFLEEKLPQRLLETFTPVAPKLRTYDLLRIGTEERLELETWILNRIADPGFSPDGKDPLKFWENFLKQVAELSVKGLGV